MQLTKAQLKRLDTFQLKGLREIFKMHTTYIERENTNKEVRKRAAKYLYANPSGKGAGKGKRQRTPPKRIPKISKEIKEAQHKLLIHVLREPTEAPTRQATFKDDKATPNLSRRKRVGRPRQHWTVQTMKRTWKQLRKGIPEHRHKTFCKRSKTIQNWLHSAAVLGLL